MINSMEEMQKGKKEKGGKENRSEKNKREILGIRRMTM